MQRLLCAQIWAGLVMLLMGSAVANAVSISHIQVRIVTGAADLSAGSRVELRIYEAGKAVRHLPLVQGQAWPRHSTRVIPLTLSEPLDPRSVVRFSLYYRAGNPQAPPWEIVAANIELPHREPPELLLDATLSGDIDRQGELATAERDVSALTCASDADCDDHLQCSAPERCAPRSAGADARGCVKGAPKSCPVNQVCTEGRGCVGPDSVSKVAPQK
jgi:hypothetical protein